MKIIDFEKFKTECFKFDKPALKMLLWDWAIQRILEELVLVDAINSCNKDGSKISKSETLNAYINSIEGERILINLIGRKEAAKVYGMLEDITSDVKTVDYILNDGGIKHYSDFILSDVQNKK